MMSEMKYKIRLLVSADISKNASAVVKRDLDIGEVKFDLTDASIDGYFILEVELESKSLTDDFYDKISQSEHLSILSDESSLARSKVILDYIAPVELQLRELAVFPYNNAPLYADNLVYKAGESRKFKGKGLTVEDELNSLLGYFDFGDMLTFLGSDAKKIDGSDLPNEIAIMMNDSSSFDDFKAKYSDKFLKLKIWDYIAKAALKTYCGWDSIESDLLQLKDIRNAALHFRVIKPSDIKKVETITKSLEKVFVRKSKPTVKSIKTLSEAMNSYTATIARQQKELLDKLQSENTARQINTLNSLLESIRPISSADIIKSAGTFNSLQDAYRALYGISVHTHENDVDNEKDKAKRDSGNKLNNGNDTESTQEAEDEDD